MVNWEADTALEYMLAFTQIEGHISPVFLRTICRGLAYIPITRYHKYVLVAPLPPGGFSVAESLYLEQITDYTHLPPGGVSVAMGVSN